MGKTFISIGPADGTEIADGGETDQGCGCGSAADQGCGCCGTAAADEATPARDVVIETHERTLRTSSYIIYADLPHNDAEMLLVHGYTGTFDKVSKRVATYVRAMEDHRAPKPLYGDWAPDPVIQSVPELPDDLVTILRKRGYLTYLTREEELDRFAAFADRLHARPTLPGYILMPTYDCNLRCFYCFQDHMRTNPDFAYLLKRMSHQMVDRIFDAMPQIDSMHGIAPEDGYERPVTLFGGEPLLAANRDLIEHILDRAHQGGTKSVSTISNATELAAYEDLLGPDNLASVQITLDGVPEEHDKRRIYPDGRGSFAVIADNITMALSRGTRIQLRMNIDRQNVGQLPVLARLFHDRGWAGDQNFMAYTAPIHPGNGKTSSDTTFSSWELDQALDELREREPEMKVILRPDDRLRTKVMSMFSHGGHPGAQSTFCGAHNGMYVIDRFGDLYACWERTGNAKIRIGKINPDATIEMATGMAAMWRTRTVTSNPVCKQCRYALYCGGGCAVLAEGRKGRIDRNFCDGFGFRFRAMVAEAYADHASGAQAPDQAASPCDV
jgi:uncharacterized protein